MSDVTSWLTNGVTVDFEDAAAALVQALSPTKRLPRDQIPFDRLKTVVSEFIAQHKTGQTVPAFNGFFNPSEEPSTSGERRSSWSALESDDNNSRLSFEEQFSTRTLGMVRAASSRVLTGGTSTTITTNGHGNCNGSNGSSGSSNRLSNERLKREIKKVRQERLNRATQNRCEETNPITGEESCLGPELFSLYTQLLAKKRSSLHCYQILTHSLWEFYKKGTFTEFVGPATAEKLVEHVIIANDQLCERHERTKATTEERLLECETQALLEVFALRELQKKRRLDDTTLVNKLQYMRLFDPVRAQKFLVETLIDEFYTYIPRTLAQICHEVSGDDALVPVDLREYLPRRLGSLQSSPCRDIPSTTFIAPIKRETSVTVNNVKKERAPRKSMPVKASQIGRSRQSSSSSRASEKVIATCATGKAASGRKRIFVPDTPEHKQAKRRYVTSNSVSPAAAAAKHRKVVKETPLQKMKRSAKLGVGRRHSPREHASTKALVKRKISQLIEHREKQLNDTLSQSVSSNDSKSSIKKHSSPETVDRSTFLGERGSTSSKKSARSISKSPSVAAKIKNQKKCFAKRNLLQRHFSDPEPFSKKKSVSPSKTISNTTPTSPTATTTARCFSILKPVGMVQQRVKASLASKVAVVVDDYCISDDVIERYKKRVDKIRSSRHRGSKDEQDVVFYGRQTTRTNLFEEARTLAEQRAKNATKITRSNSGNTGKQTNSKSNNNNKNNNNTKSKRCSRAAKNRQGRKTKATNCGNMAHALLNINNDSPLEPFLPKTIAFRLGRDVAFKLPRLCKRPSKARIRLMNRRNKQRAAAEISEQNSTKTAESDSSSVSRSTTSLAQANGDKACLAQATTTTTTNNNSHTTKQLDVLLADVSPSDRNRLEKTLLLSPRGQTNGRVKLVFPTSFCDKRVSPRRRSLSIDQSSCSPGGGRRSNRLLSTPNCLTVPHSNGLDSPSDHGNNNSGTGGKLNGFEYFEGSLSAEDVSEILRENQAVYQTSIDRNHHDNGINAD